MITLPLLEVCGQSETWVVWMSAEGMPAFFSASMIARAWAELLLSAWAAVAPFVVTPKSNEAWSGVESTVPLPVTVMVEPVDEVAERPRCGCATPAIAAATSSTPEMRRIVPESVHGPCTARRDRTSHRSATTGPAAGIPCGELS